jgi:hypothetical protein
MLVHAPDDAIDSPPTAAYSLFQYVTPSQPHCGEYVVLPV